MVTFSERLHSKEYGFIRILQLARSDLALSIFTEETFLTGQDPLLCPKNRNGREMFPKGPPTILYSSVLISEEIRFQKTGKLEIRPKKSWTSSINPSESSERAKWNEEQKQRRGGDRNEAEERGSRNIGLRRIPFRACKNSPARRRLFVAAAADLWLRVRVMSLKFCNSRVFTSITTESGASLKEEWICDVFATFENLF
uniref:Uncharacterized protein n=1 Tax=Steinernema glaseri TaxID=37863 RepID=A0A1I7YAU8_9BILA